MEKGQLERLRSDEGEWQLAALPADLFWTPLLTWPEAALCCGQQTKLKVTFSSTLVRITQLVRGFSATWKQSVEAMSREVMRSFTNFKNGTSIIQVRRACPSTDGDQCTCAWVLAAPDVAVCCQRPEVMGGLKGFIHFKKLLNRRLQNTDKNKIIS